jgi:hypothetical protein
VGKKAKASSSLHLATDVYEHLSAFDTPDHIAVNITPPG